MILLSIGLPGPFGDWCDAIITRFAGSRGEPVEFISWPPLDDILDFRPSKTFLDTIAVTMIRTGALHLVVGIREPNGELCSALEKLHAPFVVALEDPRMAVAEFIDRCGVGLTAATRAVANSCASMMRCASRPGALVLHDERDGTDPLATGKAIARHFGAKLDEAEVQNVVDDLANTGVAPRRGTIRSWSERVAASGIKLIDGALGTYAEYFAGHDLGRIFWGRDLFILSDAPSERPTGIISIAGNARSLVHGPYIHLSPGSWTAHVVLGFSKDAVGLNFFVDIYAGSELGRADFQPTHAGVFEVDITFAVPKGSAIGLEVRVLIAQHAQRGRMAFGHVVFTPVATARSEALSETLDNFEAVLEV